MLYILNIIAIIYIILLFQKKYPISLSMYWVAVFYGIYIFVPTCRHYITSLNGISDALVNLLATYSLIGLLFFIATNWFFLLKWERLEKISLLTQIQVSYKSTKILLYSFIIISIFLLSISIGINGIIKIFTSGARSLWLYQEKKTIVSTFAELSFFYIAILASVLVLSARNLKEKHEANKTFLVLLIIISIFVFARRHVIYPLFAVGFFGLSQNKKKLKILAIVLLLTSVFFIIMFLMGYLRTFGLKNLNIEAILNYFKHYNFMDIFISNTDFGASYKYFAYQIEYGDIFVGPLGYFKALFAPIPRSIWINKPIYTSIRILSILEPEKVNQGYSAASGYIGEAHAALGIWGIVIVSSIWGFICGYLDKKYHYLIKKRENMKRNDGLTFGFTLFEYYYLYTAALLITESHRGDFGAASIHFILEVLFPGILLRIFSSKYSYKRSVKLKSMLKLINN